MMMAMRGPLQLTVALIKPDVTRVPHILQGIRNRIIQEEFLVVRHKEIRLRKQETENFYAEHREKFFYNRLVTFMASGPTQALILAHENAIQRWRLLMGPTKVYKTKYEAPDTIRGMYGLTDTRNSTHGSATSRDPECFPSFFAGQQLKTFAPPVTRLQTPGVPRHAEETAAKEMKFFFPEFSKEEWYEDEEAQFRKGQIQLDEVSFIHKLL
ncbi:nucleoside diphosphate kinase 6 isoform X2 [Procambarus clarkii]